MQRGRQLLPELLDLPADPCEFQTQCCVTLDERQAGKVERRPFPDWSYLKYVTQTVDRERFVRIDKSGQVLISWALISYFLHQVLTKRGYRLGYFCQTQTKAERHVQSRFYRLYLSIPPTYKKPYAAMSNGRFLVYHDGAMMPPTSFVEPQAAEQGDEEAADKMRSETYTAALFDEAAFYPNLQELRESTQPRAGKMVIPSTANGNNDFRRLGFGNKDKPDERCLEFHDMLDRGEVETVMKGMYQWHRNGYTCLRIHYSAHPQRDPDTEEGRAWMQQELSASSQRLIDREQEISYDVAAGMPVLDSTKLVLRPQVYVPGYPLLRGTDFGFRFPFATLAQIRPKTDEAGKIIGDRMHFLHEFTLPNSTTEEFGPALKEFTDDHCPRATVKDYCDFFGGNQRTSRNPKTDVEIYNANGIYPISSPEPVKKGIEIMQKLIRIGDMEIDPNTCPTLVTAIRSGVTRGETGELPTEREKEGMHPFIDVLDSGRYIVTHAFRFVNLQKRTEDAVSRPAPMQQAHRLNNPIPMGRSGQASAEESSGVRRPIGLGDWKRTTR
jgi:hypothetical protein